MTKIWQNYYRPKKFADLHLDKIREQLLQLQKGGNLGRVWLFAGPRGTGKTSTARIIAAMLSSENNRTAVENNFLGKNGPGAKMLPYQDADVEEKEVQNIFAGNSFAVIEMDAASHRGIDDVRQLQEQLMMPPPLSPMAVYILDEAHMFTNEAFNALLKTLEEPPNHCVFILATTERHKIPATVASRCQLLNFTRASEAELLAVFENILAAEKIKAEPAALEQVARLADGSFRDGVKLLQTLANQGEISVGQVQKCLSGNQNQLVEELVVAILEKSPEKIIAFFAQLRAENWAEKIFYESFFTFLHTQLLANVLGEKNLSLNKKQAEFLLENLLAVRSGLALPYLELELALIKLVDRAKK